MKEFAHLYDHYLLRSANSVYDDEFRKSLISSNFLLNLMTDGYSQMDCTDEFLEYYPKWISKTQNNKVEGLDLFPHRFVSLGCTQGLDEFHYWCRMNGYRIRMFRGEYPYNRDCIDFNWDEDFIDDHPLVKGDAVILSFPFSASGDVHPRWEELLETCGKLDIPIFIDAAFFGTCGDVDFDFSHPSIQFIAFSTTKSLSCGNYRNGIVFSKIDTGHLSVQTSWHHGIHLNTSIGLYLMRNFSPDYLYNKYRKSYLEVCEYFKLIPTKCVHLATGDYNWSHFTRDEVFNRIGVRNAVKERYKGRVDWSG